MSPDHPTPPPTIEQITGPGELVAAIPYLLGFHPEGSLVLVGLAGSTLVVTARLDLDAISSDHDEPQPVLEDTLSALVRGGVTHVVGVIYPTDRCAPVRIPAAGGSDLAGQAHPHITARLADATADTGLTLTDCLLIAGGRWRSCLCRDRTCCPPTGTPLPDSPGPVQVAAVCDGVVVAPSRAALADRFTPEPGRDALRPLIEATARAAATATDPLHPPAGHGARTARIVLDACRSRDSDLVDPNSLPVPLGEHELVAMAVALSLTDVRDAVWTAVDDEEIDGRGLWLELARRVPAPWNAPPLFLYAWHAWRRGDGAVACIAAEAVLQADPEYSAARLLLTILTRGINPRALPRLRPATD